jgi:hypothetical protein
MRTKQLILTLALMMIFGAAFTSCEPGDDPMDNGADITSFTFDGIVGEAVIDKDALTVTATANEAVDLSRLVPAFTLSNGATAEVDATPQVSGTTAGDFTGTVTYIVKSSDSRLTNVWMVTVTKEQSEFQYFGVKSGTVVYNYHNPLYNTDQTHTLIFDDYGQRLRMETLIPPYGYDTGSLFVYILDMIAGKKYTYYDGDSDYTEAEATTLDWNSLMYHCWDADAYEWGWRENVQILTNQTIAEKDCSVFSFTSTDGDYEYAHWNNITFWMTKKDGGVLEEELKASSFSTSIPDNSFVPYGSDE